MAVIPPEIIVALSGAKVTHAANAPRFPQKRLPYGRVSATHGLVSCPMPSITTEQTSPGCRKRGG